MTPNKNQADTSALKRSLGFRLLLGIGAHRESHAATSMPPTPPRRRWPLTRRRRWLLPPTRRWLLRPHAIRRRRCWLPAAVRRRLGRLLRGAGRRRVRCRRISSSSSGRRRPALRGRAAGRRVHLPLLLCAGRVVQVQHLRHEICRGARAHRCVSTNLDTQHPVEWHRTGASTRNAGSQDVAPALSTQRSGWL